MGTQLRLPAGWAAMLSHGQPHVRLAEIDKDAGEITARVRVLFDELAEKHGIAAIEVEQGMQQFGDILTDLLYIARSDLEGELVDEMHDESSRQ